jgi:hypothetical protein
MSRLKSPERIQLDKDKQIRRERRELLRQQKEARRIIREEKRRIRESYDAKNGGDYTMKRSEDMPKHDVLCSVCGNIKSWGQFMPGDPPICIDCDRVKHGRATPAEPMGTTAEGNAQLALFES